MKTIFLFLVISYSSLASGNFEVPIDIQVDNITYNEDGSITFEGLFFLEGEGAYFINYKNSDSFLSFCKHLGLKNSTKGMTLNKWTYFGLHKTAVFNKRGAFQAFEWDDKKIDRITCSKNPLLPVMTFERQVNDNGSATITKLKYLRGDRRYSIAYRNKNDYNSACKLLGYKHYKKQNAINEYESIVSPKASLNSNGQFDNETHWGTRIVTVTCTNH